LKETIREQAARGATLLVSSHLLSLVDDLCDHLVLIRRGQVLFSGPMEEARDKFGGESSTLEEVFFALTGESESSNEEGEGDHV
jgi:ABC-2 type transport system ATP-binding protein